MAVIAVLVAVAIPTFAGQLEKSRQAVDVSNMRAAYAQAKLLVLNQDDADSQFKNALELVKKNRVSELTGLDKNFYFWYNKTDNTLVPESNLDAIFDEDGKLLTSALPVESGEPDKTYENYLVGKALTSKLIANLEDFAEGLVTYDETNVLPTVNKGIVVKISYDGTAGSATKQTFVLKDITFSDHKQGENVTSLDVDLAEGVTALSLVQGRAIDTSKFTVTAHYGEEDDSDTAEVTGYTFGYSTVAGKTKAAQLIGEFTKTGVIPVTVPVNSIIYVKYGGKIKELSSSDTVKRTITSIEPTGTVALSAPDSTSVHGLLTETASGEPAVMFTVKYTSGEDMILGTADKATADTAGKYTYKISYDNSVKTIADLNTSDLVNVDDNTDFLTGKSVYVYFKDNDGNEVIKLVGTVS